MGAESSGKKGVFAELTVTPAISLDDLVVQVWPTIEKYVARRVRNADHRDEIISRVFEALTRTWPTFRGDCPADMFVLRIAINAVKNYYARDLVRQSKQISLDIWCEEFFLQHEAGSLGPDHEVHRRDEVASLLNEVENVCSPVEEAVVEMVYQQLSMDEIATLLDLNPATVRSHFLRGRERLLAHLLVTAPDLLGGMDAVLSTVQRLESGVEPVLSPEEAEAIRRRKGPMGTLRKAMLKIAPFLAAFVTLILGVRK